MLYVRCLLGWYSSPVVRFGQWGWVNTPISATVRLRLSNKNPHTIITVIMGHFSPLGCHATIIGPTPVNGGSWLPLGHVRLSGSRRSSLQPITTLSRPNQGNCKVRPTLFSLAASGPQWVTRLAEASSVTAPRSAIHRPYRVRQWVKATTTTIDNKAGNGLPIRSSLNCLSVQ